MHRNLSRFVRLDDGRRTVVELRDLLTSELRAAIVDEVLALEQIQPERAKHVVTLATLDGRPHVSFENGECRSVVRAAGDGDPAESWLGEGVRYATPVEALSHALFLLRQNHGASFPRRFGWDRADGIVLASCRHRHLMMFERRTFADVGARAWAPPGARAIVWRRRDGAFDSTSPWATLVAIGDHDDVVVDVVEPPLHHVKLAHRRDAMSLGNVRFLLESAPELDPKVFDVRFLEPHLRSSNLIMVHPREPGFEAEIARTVARRFGDGESLLVLIAPDAAPIDGVDLAIREGHRSDQAVEALAAVFEGGVLGFDPENLREIGRESALTGTASALARPWAFGHLLGAAFEDLGWSPERVARAVAFLVVAIVPKDTRLSALDDLVRPIEELVGPDTCVLIQYVYREVTAVRLTILAFEALPSPSIISPDLAAPDPDCPAAPR